MRRAYEDDERKPEYPYPIPHYNQCLKVIKQFPGLCYTDADKRWYIPAIARLFPDIEDVVSNETRVPWLVVLPISITLKNPEFDFPYYAQEIILTNKHKQIKIRMNDGDFRAGRAVGLIFPY